MASFQKDLDLPLQLYAPYFCNNTDYFNGSTPYTAVESNVSIDGCGHYHFLDVSPDQSRDFYDWFFAKGEAVNMVSFEPDFMNQNYNCVPEFIHSATNASVWQHGMADAALAKNLSVQWCYATPTDVLASLTMPAVTNFRVSNDFCYGESWNIGMSSLIVWAAGAAPSKDTVWSTDNDRFAVPGCPWGPDHEEPAAELHVLLTLMSTGPVGLSDGYNMSNAALLKRTITTDGTLLKPTKPVTAVDSEIAGLAKSRVESSGHEETMAEVEAVDDGADGGHVWSSFSGEKHQPSPPILHGLTKDAWAVSAYYFLSFMLKQATPIPASDFYPARSTESSPESSPLYWRTFDGGVGCVDGAAASSCVSSSQTIAAPASDFSNTTGGTQYSPVLTTAWPKTCAIMLLGDLTKYIAMSTVRFTAVKCTAAGGVEAMVHGAAGEIVPATLIKDQKVLVVSTTIPASGVAKLSVS
jgi:hypothetical protein